MHHHSHHAIKFLANGLLPWLALACSTSSSGTGTNLAIDGTQGDAGNLADASVSVDAAASTGTDSSASSAQLSSSATATAATASASVSATNEIPFSMWTSVEQAGLSTCQERHSEQADSCDYELACDGEQVTTHCSLSADGWNCDCRHPDLNGEFGIAAIGENAFEVCKNAVNTCVTGGLDAATPVCDVKSLGSGANCVKKETCNSEWALGETSVSIFKSHNEVTCNAMNGRTSCSCFNEGRRFTLRGAGVDESCDKALEYCGVPLPEMEADECDAPIVSATDTACFRSVQCGNKVTGSDPDVYAFLGNAVSTTRCQKGMVSGFDCTCRSAEGNVKKVSLDAEGSESSCLAASDYCADDYNPVSVSAAECAPATVSDTDATHCSVNANCFQAVESALTQLKLAAPLSANCHGEGPEYQCSCGEEETTFAVNASALHNACEAAVNPCANRAHLKLDDDRKLGFEYGQAFPAPSVVASVSPSVEATSSAVASASVSASSASSVSAAPSASSAPSF